MSDYSVDPGATIERLIAERDAALGREVALREDLDNHDSASQLMNAWVAEKGQMPWVTAINIVAIVTKMPDEERQRLIDMDDGSTERGALIAKIDALQRRLTAADERADVLEGLLRVSIIAMKRIYQAGYNRIIAAGGTCDTPEYMMESDPTVRDIRAALKPAEGRGDA